MNVITDLKEATTFVRNLENSLSETSYWTDWYFLDVYGAAPLDWIKQAKITTLLRPHLPEEDGSIVWLDGCLAAFFPSANRPDFSALREAMIKTLGSDYAQLDGYRILEDPDQTRALLARRRGRENQVREAPTANYSKLKTLVPDIDNLLRDWHKERSHREGRAKPLVMIVDDDEFVLRLVSRALSGDAEIVTAKNGAEAIARHLQQMPDIIFLDIGLPDCDGLSLLNYMQQYDTECRIVMFSADSFVKTKVKAIAGGAKGFLSKPFNLSEFQKQISAWLSR